MMIHFSHSGRVIFSSLESRMLTVSNSQHGEKEMMDPGIREILVALSNKHVSHPARILCSSAVKIGKS